MPVVHVSPATSQNAQRLANDLRRVIDEHERAHPGLSKADIHEALQLAGQSSGAKSRRKLVLTVVMGVLFAFGLLAYLQFRAG